MGLCFVVCRLCFDFCYCYFFLLPPFCVYRKSAGWLLNEEETDGWREGGSVVESGAGVGEDTLSLGWAIAGGQLAAVGGSSGCSGLQGKSL